MAVFVRGLGSAGASEWIEETWVRIRVHGDLRRRVFLEDLDLSNVRVKLLVQSTLKIVYWSRVSVFDDAATSRKVLEYTALDGDIGTFQRVLDEGVHVMEEVSELSIDNYESFGLNERVRCSVVDSNERSRAIEVTVLQVLDWLRTASFLHRENCVIC